MEKEEKKNKRLIALIIVLIIIILIAFWIIANIIGKIGYIKTSSEPINLIEVTQEDIGWNMLEELKIFQNDKYDNKNIIAPKSTGTYSFFVNNVTDKDLIYDLQLKEINDYNINIKYKLKLENVYVSGSNEKWLDINEIGLENVIITANSTNRYILEWYWIDDDINDTKIGSLSYVDYTLRIKIGAQIYEK